ncbi:glycosyltransferase family 4 protein [Mycobacterium sp. ITM-2016-00317]|uniref:glycosyltransferase family 4 protein n=1 Tax=Mycobacterium sp. ITM-2016-00317 TaxID=2099694 RepID=UPI00287FBF0D|nr:glycosyltransferase family 4 protein [Mycobacterium sp. ITM-2016-00317]WNG86742.1 glycosyltransferase family 4 protein [Mycobacterium sp. ITM-2016-00317]
MTKSALRVGILVPRFAPFRGGMETYVASAAAALAAEGAEVTVITQAPRSAALPRRELCDGYAIERYPLPLGDFFDVSAPAAARAAATPGRFEVVWLHSYHTPLAWLGAERATAPVVFTPHYHGVGHTPLRHVLHFAYRPAGRRLMAASRRVVVDTEAEARLVLRDFAGQVSAANLVIIPPAVAKPRLGLPRPYADGRVVLTVARQETYKRTDLLIRAVARLRDEGEPVHLVVIGDGAALGSLRALTSQLNADRTVTFTGFVDEDTLGDWWASASLYATASEQEAYGIGLAEALLSGLPVVASGIPAHREVADRAGPRAAVRLCAHTASDSDAASLYAEAIVRMLSTPGSRTQRAAECALPRSADVGQQLLATLSAVSQIESRV